MVKAFPRTAHFKEDIIQAFYEGIKHKPETTFGNVKADVLADKDRISTAGISAERFANCAGRFRPIVVEEPAPPRGVTRRRE